MTFFPPANEAIFSLFVKSAISLQISILPLANFASSLIPAEPYQMTFFTEDKMIQKHQQAI